MLSRARLYALCHADLGFGCFELTAQDFEGQRLAEMLSTVLLGAAGVRCAPPTSSPCTHVCRLSHSSSATSHKTSGCRSTSGSPAPYSPSWPSSRRGRSTTRTPRAGCRPATQSRPSTSTWTGRKWARTKSIWGVWASHMDSRPSFGQNGCVHSTMSAFMLLRPLGLRPFARPCYARRPEETHAQYTCL
jgi:hypothetical protein